MNKKVFALVTVIVCLLFGVFTIIPMISMNAFSIVISFPWVQIGNLIVWFNSLGNFGKGLALFCWALISISPLALVFFIKSVRKNIIEVISCSALCLFIGVGLYFVINPSINSELSKNVENIGSFYSSIGAGLIWASIIVVAIIFILCSFRSAKTPKLIKFLKIALYICGGIVLFSFMTSVADFVNKLIANNFTTCDLIIGIVRIVFAAGYGVLGIITVYSLGKTITSYNSETDDNIVVYAKQSSKLCFVLAIVSLTTQLLINMLSLALGKYLTNLNITISISILDIVIPLVALLISKLIEKNKTIQEDNDLII